MNNEQDDTILAECAQKCLNASVGCQEKICECWIDFSEDNNCDLISIKKHGQMTLRQIGERLGVSFVRVKQIEDSAIKKIKQSIPLDMF